MEELKQKVEKDHDILIRVAVNQENLCNKFDALAQSLTKSEDKCNSCKQDIYQNLVPWKSFKWIMVILLSVFMAINSWQVTSLANISKSVKQNSYTIEKLNNKIDTHITVFESTKPKE